jgi:class 3 adenylate cyclase/DNA-binding NarL/FixJ family response regulator
MTAARTTTFLFTDLVGSTEILDDLGEEAAAELSDVHFGILREAVSRHGGQEVKTIGDSLMVAFSSAFEAVACAIEIQQAIERHNRDAEGPPLLVRVGVHAGEPLPSGEDDYFGSTVVVARRLCDQAQGAQVLVSAVVRDLIGRRGSFSFLGLGKLELKGLQDPVDTYSVLWRRNLQEMPPAQLAAPAAPVSAPLSARRRVLIVEDEPLWTDLLVFRLTREAGVDVVGCAADGPTALRLAEELGPDAVIMDIGLKGEMDGIQAALRIKQASPGTGIVILSAHNDRRYITSLPLSERPGWSYLLKQSVPDVETILRAVEASIDGLAMIDSAVLAGLQPRPASALEKLSPGQLDVLRLMAEGRSDSGIAAILHTNDEGVRSIITGIYHDLGLSGHAEVNSRVRAVVLFLEETRLAR